MTKFRIGQQVYAPVYRYPQGQDAPFALTRGIVRAIARRSCDVELQNGFGTQTIASSMLHADVGVCIVRIGDFKTERSAMDPISKSVLNFLRLLLPDDQLLMVELRTEAELDEVFQIYASAYTLWVIVGHGSESGDLLFTRGERAASSALADKLSPHAASPRTFLFLSCHTGRAAFAREFSQRTALCSALIGPTGALHSAVASQFAQTFLSYLFLEGRQIGVAFNKAIEQVPTATRFRLWRKGSF